MTLSDDQVKAMARAMRAEAERFHDPADLYIRDEALLRGLVQLDQNDPDNEDNFLESYKLLVRAALSAV